MTSGLNFSENYGTVSTVNKMLWLKADAGGIAEMQPLIHDINTQWYYSSGTTNILSNIIRRQFADYQDYINFPFESLFKPLGMSSAIIETDANGTFVGSSLMYATARDWARFGVLYLNDGVWDEVRILPEEWVEYSSSSTPVQEFGFYSSQWWNNATRPIPNEPNPTRYWPNVPGDAFYASGFEGQNVVVIPSQDLVIVRLGLTQDRKMWDIGHFTTLISKAVE